MKKIIAIALCCVLVLSGCANSSPVTEVTDDTNSVEENVEESVDEKEETIDVSKDASIEPDIDFKGLDDENLTEYVEDAIYMDLVAQLDSTDYVVEKVEAIYYPKEYIEELAFNSQENIYFGYTASELEKQFKGTRYVFTLGENGQTVVVPMETIDSDGYGKVIEDVMIGTGVILVCVTVSVVSGGLGAPAVAMIFAASAETATTFAVSSMVISGAAAAITTGYQTEDAEKAFKAGLTAGAEGFKWGAITGAVAGGAAEGFALYGATSSGLTMNEVAAIQQESGYPLELIKQFKSVEEYNVYKDAGLYTKMVNGKMAMVRDIDLNYVSELPNGEQVTNLVRMQKGYAPLDPATGKAYQLHHINQASDGTLAILTEAEHQGNATILNTLGKESEIDRAAFDKIRKEFWQKLGNSLATGV